MHSNPVHQTETSGRASSASRRPTLCPLNNHFHMAELFFQLFFGLLSALAVSSPERVGVSDLGSTGSFLDPQ